MIDADLQARREALVHEHMTTEMAGDIEACLKTFDPEPVYDIVPLGAVQRGVEAVGGLLGALLGAFPDLGLHIEKLHHAADAVIIEGRMTGTHRGEYEGHPPTGRSMDCRCAVFFHFDGERMLDETVFYDDLTILRQLGVA